MIFPSESVQQAREELAERLERGERPSAAELEQALAADPEGFLPLFLLAAARHSEGDVAAAEQLARRGVVLHPCSFQFPVMLAGILAQKTGGSDMSAGWMELAVEKVLADPEALDHFAPQELPPSFADPESLRNLASELAERAASEPAEASRELLPHRLVHELQESLGNQLDRRLVDEILAHKEECRPLLIGLLRGLAEGYLPEGGEIMAEAALALLGEMADPATLPALIQFTMVDEKPLSEIASWAVHRTATLQPAAALAAFRDFDRRSSGGERASIAEALAVMPEAPGRVDALLALLENFGNVEPEDRTSAFLIVASALIAVAGAAAPALIREAIASLGPVLPAPAVAEAKKLLKAYAAGPEVFTLDPDEGGEASTVYDICCADRLEGRDEDEEEEEDEEGGHVHGPGCSHDHAPPPPGRNDPCWCGSGQKYKKCHLQEDEAARRAEPGE